MGDPTALRSYLYAPGSSERMLGKVLETGADAVVLDLEDAVAPSEKHDARVRVAGFVAERGPTAAPEVHVRVNRGPGGFDAEDVRAVVVPGLAALRLPKCADPDEIRRLDEELCERERGAGLAQGQVALYPGVESAAAVLAAAALAAASPRVARLAFGAVDFLADIDVADPDDESTVVARSTLVLASRAAGVGAPVDSVHAAVDDLAGLRGAALRARRLGLFGKSVIHPRQVAVVNEVFTPTDEEIARARARLVDYEEATGEGRGAIRVGTEFVDAAAALRARRLVELADRLARSGESAQE